MSANATAPMSSVRRSSFAGRLRAARRRNGMLRQPTTFSTSTSGRGCTDELAIIADRCASSG